MSYLSGARRLWSMPCTASFGCARAAFPDTFWLSPHKLKDSGCSKAEIQHARMAYEESLATAGEEACDLSSSEEEEESESEDGAGERGGGGAVDAMAESEVAEGAGAIGAIGE